MEKVTYRCKNCGWEKSITVLWADISPTRCGNHKCKYSGRNKKERTSFVKEPNMLDIILPKKEEKVEVVEKSTQIEEKVVEKRESHKSKRKKARGV